MKISRKRFAALAVVAAVGLAACGGDDDDATDTTVGAVDTDTTVGADDTATTEAGTATTEAGTATSEATDEGTATTGATEEAPATEIDFAALSGDLVGGGASSQNAAMEGWKAGFGELAPGVNLSYDPVGSGGGREGFLDGSFDFAGSDAALDDEEYAASIERCAGDGGAVNLPHYISPIAVFYNLPAIDGTTLNLSPENVAGIFAGTITTWNDPALVADNPDAALPDTAINPVHRSDESGTTKNFTNYLSIVAPDVWTYEDIELWDDGPGTGEGADGTSGVVAAVTAGEGSIGYADASQIGSLPAAAIGVGDEFVAYSAEAAAAVVDGSPRVEGRSEFDFAYELERDLPGTYPVVLVSYHIVCLQYDTQEKVDQIKAFMTYVGSAEGQEASSLSAGSAPLSADVSAQLEQVIAQISVG